MRISYGIYGQADWKLDFCDSMTRQLADLSREWQESRVAEAEPGMEGRFPVHLVDRVNHAQIGSGDVPSFVTVQHSLRVFSTRLIFILHSTPSLLRVVFVNVFYSSSYFLFFSFWCSQLPYPPIVVTSSLPFFSFISSSSIFFFYSLSLPSVFFYLYVPFYISLGCFFRTLL
jgi:hypothetical protein